MNRGQRKAMSIALGVWSMNIENERKTLLMNTDHKTEQHVMMAGSLMAEAASKLAQAMRYLDEPTPAHKRPGIKGAKR